MQIPMVDLAAQFEEIGEEVRAGLDRVMSSTAFVGGPDVTAFETEFAHFTRVRHCIGVANGTDALELALRAAGVSAKDEVIVPVNTFIATAEAVSRIGAVPVFVDVDDDFLLIDPAQVDRAITAKTKAVVPVHLFGQAAPVEAIAEIAADRGIPVIEDAAQSQGAYRNGQPCGSLGLVAATSFYPGKNLGAAGDAGAVTTNDGRIAERVRLLGAHGSQQKYVHSIVGMNSRLDTLQAVVLRAKLARLENWNNLRRQCARYYDQLLRSVDGVRVPATMSGNEHVWHLYVVRVHHRDDVMAALQSAGVGAGIHYPTPLHLTDAYADARFERGAFPVAEKAAGEILSLPIYPHLAPETQEYVVETLATLAVDA